MPSGLQVINSNGYVQVDENFRNLVFKEKGTFSGSPYTFSRSGLITPLLAFRSTGATGVGLDYISRSGGTHTWHALDPGFNGDWWLFDAPTDLGSNFGMQVFTAVGALAFDSNRLYMKPTDMAPITYGNHTTASDPLGINEPSGTHAWVFSTPAWYRTGGDVDTHTFRRFNLGLNGSEEYVSYITGSPVVLTGSTVIFGTLGSATLIDVAGL
jgi:hypothetical protein